MSISETGKKFMLGSLITATGASMLSCDDKIVNESKKNDEILMTSSDVIKSEEDKVAKIDPENMIVILNSETIPTPIPTLEPIPTSTPTPEVIPTQTNPTEVTLIPEIIEQSPCVVIYKGDPDKKEIALTFDDQGENLGKILEVLDAAGVKGTFFLLTSEIKNNPERWQQAVVNGHLICNHSTKHDMSLGSKSEEAIKEDIL
ncbi:MAG: polysaccharide deacetylase family protein, partial [Candidatus Shapirobacteria bacterium]